MKRIIVLLSVVFLFSANVSAQTPLSLEDCINIALRENSIVRNSQTDVSTYKGLKRASYSFILPNLSINAGPSRNYRAPTTFTGYAPVGVDPQTGQVRYESVEITSPANTTENYSFGLSWSQNFWDQGRWWNQIHQAGSDVRAAELNYESTKLNTIALVKARYFELLKVLEQRKVAVESVDLALEQLKQSKVMFEIGTVAQIDIFTSQVNHDRNKINLINQDLIIENAKRNLNLAMGRDSNTSVEIDGNIPLDVNYDISGDELTGRALILNPELQRLEQMIQSSELGYKIAKSSRYPTFSYFINYSRNNSDIDRIYNDITKNYSLTVGMNFRYTLFDGFTTKGNIQRSKNAISINEENLENQKRILHSNIKNYHEQLMAFEEKIEINRAMIVAAEEGLRLANERYRVGSGTLIETIDAQVQLTSARYNLLELRYDALIVEANLHAAIGSN